MRSPQTILKRPLVTEKGTHLRESGGRADFEELAAEDIRSKVTFEVARDANKIEIRQAVQQLFSVKVTDVRTQIVRGKEKRLGRFVGKRANWKKAVVTLAAGETIDLFEGA